MSVARMSRVVRAVLVYSGIVIGGVIAGYLVFGIVTLALVASVGAYLSVIVPLVVGLAIMLSVVGFAVVRRDEVGRNRRLAVFLVACAAPSLATVALFVAYFVYRSQL